MTGYGEARQQQDDLTVTVEVRTVNNRYLKTSYRCTEGYSALESILDADVRKCIKRGTVYVNVRVNRHVPAERYSINKEVLESYLQQLQTIRSKLDAPTGTTAPLESYLTLPGVVHESHSHDADVQGHASIVRDTLKEALDGLDRMRCEEGLTMSKDLLDNCHIVEEILEKISELAPQVIDSYRERITERLNQLLVEFDVTVQPEDVIREVGLFAERVDIAEETVRLKSHIQQFDSHLQSSEASGRKLEFMIQEMFRETNTIGSKANSSEISKHVVDIKALIERMREMVQNVE